MGEHLRGHGFDPEVCAGCPQQVGILLKRCALCNCPTGRGLFMDRLDAPPASCIRLDAHENQRSTGYL